MSFQEYSESLRGKLHVGEMSKRAIAGIAAILGIAAIGLCIALGAMGLPGGSEALVVKPAEAADAEVSTNAEGASAAPRGICVHIGGCVALPGVVSLEEGARVADAVEAAGGLTEDAAAEAVNLARVVEDGEQVIVPSTEQVRVASVVGESATAQAPSTQDSGASSGKVNLNTASSTELQTLSGIGASKAQKIIAYRESKGAFKSVDDLTKVSGIGEKTLESIRDQICV